MGQKIISELLQQSLQKAVDNKSVYSIAMKVEDGSGNISWSGTAGDMNVDSRYFIASVTKMYITVIVMKLIEAGKIALEDLIIKHLPDQYCNGIHVLKGTDYSNQITIKHLISNTSGIPDYFFHQQKNGKTVADELLDGHDEPWPLDRTIGLIKKLKPNFKPGAKAAYSDSNYQLLGKIIEEVTGQPIQEVMKLFIFEPLGLKNTYIYDDPSDTSPTPFYYGAKKLWLPQYMASIAPEGGIVSTVDEVMIFLKAFFSGVFFPKEKIESMKQWKMILPPPGLFLFGIGLEKLWIPWILSPFKYPGEILGFWGQTGSFAFYNPKADLYFCGATNQINGRGHRKATGLMLKTIKSLL
ncbi:serine hydrolase domain-containing protein [Mongoliibacter ruber]|uniref:CubicO group peptidase (Beta-lactamase class C family) n=1 Tax=Mongoliibacter ruber TaxID=1750599 RepID=A0A2T0WA16_9BACT|nr:serine hydrolase domain-containing protein [Mongoliibacter ruber]PRY83548.1 CubicO group peptidase (beta-lactamase class C family) [Mongoliibacter ruber]